MKSVSTTLLPKYSAWFFVYSHHLLLLFHFIPVTIESPIKDYNEVTALSAQLKESVSNNHQTESLNTNDVMPSPWHKRWGIRSEPAGTSWNYAEIEKWASIQPTCGGARQSPVDIDSRSLRAYPQFTFENYGNVDKMVATNNGHTVLFSLPPGFSPDSIPFITGGGLSDQYKFQQFHIHWGSDSSKGSEHVLRSKRYAAEIHFVHYNTKYGTFAESTKYEDGLAVLGVFVEVGNNDNPAFLPLVDQVNEVLEEGDETTLTNLVLLKNLLPSRTSSFYRYTGSLTTPACNEIVIWTVFDQPISVSENQLSKLRKLKDEAGKQLVDNYRPPQPLNGRTITYRSKTGCQISDTWPLSFIPIIDAFQYITCVTSFYRKSFLSNFGLNFV